MCSHQNKSDELEYDIEDSLNKLKQYMQDDKRLAILNPENDYLLRFLYSTNLNVSSAFKKLRSFYDLLIKYPEWFTMAAPLEKKNIIDRNIRIVPGTYDKEGRIIYIIKVANMDASTMDIVYDIAAVDEQWVELYMLDPASVLTKKGASVIIDISNFQLKFMKYLTPHNIRIILSLLQAFPVNEVRFHLVKDSILVHAAIKLVWKFLPQHIRDAVHFHFYDWTSLYQYVDKEALPVEYGGTKQELYMEYHQKLLEKNSDIAKSFQKHRQYFLNMYNQNYYYTKIN